MSLQRTFATLDEAQAIYRAQLAKQRLFVETPQAPTPGTPLPLVLVVAETGGRLELESRVLRVLDAQTASAHRLGAGAGVVLEVRIDEHVREPLRALLVGELRGTQAQAELAREVAEFVARTEAASHYEVLGVALDAAARDVRAAYLKLIKRFHPDTYFKRVDAATQAALELAYQRITAAFETLTDARRRDKYDVSIGNFADTSHGSSAQVKAEVARLAEYRQKNAAGIQRARELWESALDDEKAGDVKSARNKLRLAMTFDPQNPRFKRKLDELQQRP